MRGYHIYQTIWSSSIGEVLNCAREPQNGQDTYAVATKKAGDVVVGHIQCTEFHFSLPWWADYLYYHRWKEIFE